ncbi:MAG: hypothetical protein QM758_03150 [Armatimonas sp.]
MAAAFLGPYTGELHAAMLIGLAIYWVISLLLGIYHSRFQRSSPIHGMAAVILLESAAIGTVLIAEKLVERAFYHGADDDPTWMIARDTLHLGDVVFWGALVLLILIAPWLSSKDTPKPG